MIFNRAFAGAALTANKRPPKFGDDIIYRSGFSREQVGCPRRVMACWFFAAKAAPEDAGTGRATESCRLTNPFPVPSLFYPPLFLPRFWHLFYGPIVRRWAAPGILMTPPTLAV